MLASQLYALGRNAASEASLDHGPEECHWCSAKCDRRWPHGESPPPPFVRLERKCRRPNNAYVCVGCWHWRQRSVSVRFLSGRLLDRQRPCDHSWLVTAGGCWGIDKRDPKDCETLYRTLLMPPLRFALLLKGSQEVLLQYGEANDLDEVRADTPLHFTYDNVAMRYAVYDLEVALKHPRVGGNDPGVGTLLREFGRPECFAEVEEKKRRGGQAKKDEETGLYTKRVVSSKAAALKSA